MVITTEKFFIENAKQYLESAKKEKIVILCDDGTEMELYKKEKE